MILRAFLAVVPVLALIASGSVHAQQYRWVDKNGRIQYSDAPPPAGAKDVRKTAPATDTGGTAPQTSFELAKAQKDFPVTLYTSPNCKEGCDLVRGALNKRAIPFKEVQVYDQESNEELRRVSGSQEVPTLLVGRSVQKGFEQEAFDTLLDSAGYPKAGVLKPLAHKAPPPPEGFAPPAEATPKPAPAAAQKSGRYDPSGLVGPEPKQGRYGIPGETK